MKNRKGFTLVEVIVVLVILAVLAAIALPSMLGFVNDSKEKALLAEARAAYIAAQAYVTEKVGLGTFESDEPVGGGAGPNSWADTVARYIGETPNYMGVIQANGKVLRIVYQKTEGEKYVHIDVLNGTVSIDDNKAA